MVVFETVLDLPDLASLDHEARDVAARLELDACGGSGLRVRENQALIVQPVVALDEDRVADVRSEGRLEPVDVVAFQKLDAEFLEIRPRRDVTPLLGRRRRIDGPARVAETNDRGEWILESNRRVAQQDKQPRRNCRDGTRCR